MFFTLGVQQLMFIRYKTQMLNFKHYEFVNTCKRPCILELLNIGRSFTGGSCNINNLNI